MPYADFYVDKGGSNLNSGSSSGVLPIYENIGGTWATGTTVSTFTTTTDPTSSNVVSGMYAAVYADSSTSQNYVGKIIGVTASTIEISRYFAAGTLPSDGTSNRTIRVGGAWSGPSGNVTFPFTFITSGLIGDFSNVVRVNVKKNSVAYSTTAALAPAATSNTSIWEGYYTTPGDRPVGANRPIILGPTTGTSFITVSFASVANSMFMNFIVENNGTTGTNPIFNAGTESLIFNCSFKNGVRSVAYGANSVLIGCEAVNCNTSNTVNRGGFGNNDGNDPVFINCVAQYNTTGNTPGFFFTTVTGSTYVCINCISKNNGLVGYRHAGRSNFLLINSDSLNNPTGVSVTVEAAQTNSTYIINSNIVNNNVGIFSDLLFSSSCVAIDCGFYANGANTGGASSGAILLIDPIYHNELPYSSYDNLTLLRKYIRPTIFNLGSGVADPLYSYESLGAILPAIMDSYLNPSLNRVIS